MGLARQPMRFRGHLMPRGTSFLLLTIRLLRLFTNPSAGIADAKKAAEVTGEIPETVPPWRRGKVARLRMVSFIWELVGAAYTPTCISGR